MFDQNQQTQSAPIVPEPVAATPTSSTDTAMFNTTTVDPEPTTDAAAPTAPEPTPAEVVETPASEPAKTESSEATPADDSLQSIKKDALQNLTPLLSQLDQSPEEKFRTTMMLIQASDDKSLIQSAYNAAKDIADEKVRAQALLDIVNEINYFTQENEDE